MKHISITLFFLFIVIFGVSTAKAEYSCEKFSPLVFYVGSDPIIFSSEKKVSKIQGVAIDPFKKPTLKVYVFLFNKPNSIKNKDFSVFDLEEEQSVSACETGEDGKFCFENISRGKYIVCAYTSSYSGFTSKTTCAFIKLESESKKLKQMIKLPLDLQDL